MTSEKQQVWKILKDVKSKKPEYDDVVEFRISGIPCLLGVISFNRVAGSYSYNADSDVDYYGYTECEFDVLDRKGYKAPWLERKMTSKDHKLAEEAVSEYYHDDEPDYDDYY